MKEIKPSPYFSFVVHLDGLEKTTIPLSNARALYNVAVQAIRDFRAARYRVCTNTTLVSGNQPEEYHRLFAMLNDLGVEGMMVAPGFQYREVAHHDIFMQRDEARSFFRRVFDGCAAVFAFTTTRSPRLPDGRRNTGAIVDPAYTPAGWRKPCYLLADGHATSFAEAVDTTDWKAYGFGRDPRCNTCMMHCGYEVPPSRKR
jgi:hopanoid biosynthesis associated radical SAM protein HpnH